MSKAENTYWGSSNTARHTKSIPKKSGQAARMPSSNSQWLAVGISVSLTVMLILTVNFRAFSVLNKEAGEGAELKNKIQVVTSENLAMQEEIHYLKNDSDTIGREAKKFGLSRQNKEKVPVPAK